MKWRKWVVRFFVFLVLACVAGLGLAYQAWTNPAATRQQVLDTMTDRLPGAITSLESARLRLLGGIAYSDLHLARKDDVERRDFLYSPSGIILHDKEHLINGRVATRKIVMTRPRLHIIREKDGRTNLDDIVGPVNLKERVPTIVMEQGTILFEDHGLSASVPVVEIKNVSLTVINDPIPTLNIEVTGLTDVAGQVQIHLKHDRATRTTTGTLDLPDVPLADNLIQRVATLAPDVGNHLRYIKGTLKLHTTLDFDPARQIPLCYDAALELQNGQFSHARLPLPLEDATAQVRVVNGLIALVHIAGHSGEAAIELTAKDLTPSADCEMLDEPPPLEKLVREFDLRIEHARVTDKLVEQMPESVRLVVEPYAARGPMTFRHHVQREADGKWRKTWNVTAEGMTASYHHDFDYQVENITGTVDVALASDGSLDTAIKLQGYAGAQVVHVDGTVVGEKHLPRVDLTLSGNNILLDEKLLRALAPESRQLAQQFLPDKSRKPSSEFQPAGLGDFTATIYREAGQDRFNNRFIIHVHDASVKYDVFPYPLENVTATLDLQPDHWECRDAHGTHKGGEIRVSAQSYSLPEPGPFYPSQAQPPSQPRQRVQVVIHGNQILLDDSDFLAALGARPNLQQTWKKLAIAGRMNFDATVVDDPREPQNIDVSVDVQGCRMCPHFFPYPMEDVSGHVRYVQDSVYLTDVKARHGTSLLGLAQGRVILKPNATGFQQVRLRGIKGSPLVPDAALLQALPEEVQAGLAALHLTHAVDVATDLVIDQPPDPNTPLAVWWDGRADLRHADLRAGVDVTELTGQFSCCGLHNGKHLEKVVGTFLFNEAMVLGQPVQDLHGRLEVRPDSPAILRFRDLSGSLFGGTLGGEARIEFGPIVRYDVFLKALQVELSKFGLSNLGNGADLQGAAMAAVHLKGEGSDLAGLKGEGRLDVPSGKLYKLPPLLDLLKAFGLRVPDRIAFEQAHAAFRIDGPQLHVDQLDLYGNAVSLRGQGMVNLDGSDLNLDFNADWGRMNQLFPEEITEFSRAVSDQLLKIKMRGRIGEIRLERVLVPGIVEPAKKAFQLPPS